MMGILQGDYQTTTRFVLILFPILRLVEIYKKKKVCVCILKAVAIFVHFFSMSTLSWNKLEDTSKEALQNSRHQFLLLLYSPREATLHILAPPRSPLHVYYCVACRLLSSDAQERLLTIFTSLRDTIFHELRLRSSSNINYIKYIMFDFI